MLVVRNRAFLLLEAMVTIPLVMILFTIVVGALFASLTGLRIQSRQEVCRRLAQDALDTLSFPPVVQELTPVQEAGEPYSRDLQVEGPVEGCYLVTVSVRCQQQGAMRYRRMIPAL